MIERGRQTHVVLVTFAVPHPGLQGDPMICWGIVKQLQAAGHQMTVVLLEESESDVREEQTVMRVALEDEGVPCVTVPANAAPQRRGFLRVLLRPQVEDFYPSASMAPGTARTIAAIQPDVVIGFDFRALAALRHTRGIPRIGAVPSWNPAAKVGRWRYAIPPSLSWAYLRTTLGLLKLWQEPRILTDLLRDCDVAGHFAAQHAAWARAHGVPACRYYRMPLTDDSSHGGARRSASAARPKFILVGRLAGTLTLAGLYLFAREMLPEMERRFGQDGFEVHVIGRDELPMRLASRLAHPAVKVRGFVEDLEAELASAVALLVPNPVNFSFRVRILTAFASSCCVIAHQVNAAGTPEFAHDVNLLLGRDGRELGQLAWELAQDPPRRERLVRRARETYEQWFHPQAEAAGLLTDVERLAGSQAVLSGVS